MKKDLFYEMDSISLKNNELLLGETIFHNANGYIGVRGAFEEGYPLDMTSIRGQYINGFYDIVDMKQAEPLFGLIEEKQTIVNVVDTQGIMIEFGNEHFSMFEGKIVNSKRFVNMSNGLTTRKISWISPNGFEFTFEFKRLTSFVRLPLFLQEVTIISHNYSGPVKIISKHNGEVSNFSDRSDPRVASESKQYIKIDKIDMLDHMTFINASTSRSGLQVCSGVGHRIPDGYHAECVIEGNGALHIVNGNLSKGNEIKLVKYSWFADSIRSNDAESVARTGLTDVMTVPISELYREQQEYLEEYWAESNLEIEGDEALNLAVHFNQYNLLQSAGRDCFSSMAAKGLSGEGYEGHYFWDTEIYALPCFSITKPEIAKNLISYRYQTLEEAKENARMLGHSKGALYAWRTINGKECSGYFPSGTAAYHISGDVAYSVISYFLATHDENFLCDYGAEIILETARLWIDMGKYVKGKFRIPNVTGPDEYTCLVNNNYYTNALAKYNLDWAGKCKIILTQAGKWEGLCEKIELSNEELEQFKGASECMYLLYDEELDINPQDDSFLEKDKWDFNNTPKEKYPLLMNYHPLTLYRKQVCKQADTVLAHFILEDYQKFSTIRNSYFYYESITTHDSSLSTCIFSIMAAKLGMVDKAYEYFGESAKLDLFNTHGNTKDGIHTANMAGNYMAIVYGFAGLRIKESGLYLKPSIPKQWKSYRFRFIYCGTQLEVEVNQETCVVRRLCGNEISLHLYGEDMFLDDLIHIPLK